MNNYPITATTPLSQQVRNLGISDMAALLTYIQQLPYGRNKTRSDLSLVLSAKKGTCSSKHALIKQVALENGDTELQLIIGLYKMTPQNTPGIGKEMYRHGLQYIPEAHCYLKWKNQRIDLTKSNSDFSIIEDALLEEQLIVPHQIGSYKVAYHRNYLKKWLLEEAIEMDLESLWLVREGCIANLSNT